MASFTTQILIGNPSIYHGGINPFAQLFLSENSRPAWILDPYNINPSHKSEAKRIVWIPTLEHMLEDALLMISVHINRNDEILQLANDWDKDIRAERLEMYEVFNDGQRLNLYERIRKDDNFPKLVVTVLEDSSIFGYLKVLKEFDLLIEVCIPIYSRDYSPWTKKFITRGSLEPE